MAAQLALKHTYLPAIAAGLISVAGSYITNQPINNTLVRHEKLLDQHGKLLEHHGKLHQETNEKLNEIQRMLRKKSPCFLR